VASATTDHTKLSFDKPRALRPRQELTFG